MDPHVAALAAQVAALTNQVAALTNQVATLQQELQWYHAHSPVHPPAPPVAAGAGAEPAWWVFLGRRPPRACASNHMFSPTWGSV